MMRKMESFSEIAWMAKGQKIRRMFPVVDDDDHSKIIGAIVSLEDGSDIHFCNGVKALSKDPKNTGAAG